MRALALASAGSALALALAACAAAGERRPAPPPPGHAAPAAPSPPPGGAPPAGPVVYDVVPSPDLARLDVAIAVPPGVSDVFALERGAEAHLGEVSLVPAGGGPPMALPRVGSGVRAPEGACKLHGCSLRYAYALRAAAVAFDDVDRASLEAGGRVVEASPPLWLLAPFGAAPSTRLRVRVRGDFSVGLPPDPEAPEAVTITLEDLPFAPYALFGPQRVTTLDVPSSSSSSSPSPPAKVRVAVLPGALPAPEPELVAWTAGRADALARYLGRFPLPHPLVALVPSGGRYVGPGRSMSGGGGTVLVWVGERASARERASDWVLLHEMIHFVVPWLPGHQQWVGEGLATWVEPVVRVRAGLGEERDVWGALVKGLRFGVPTPANVAARRGFDAAPSWATTYWGGALFWFLADVRIAERTGGKATLRDALAGLVREGGSSAVRWPLPRVLAACDRGSGTTVLTELYAELGTSARAVDLERELRELGVRAGPSPSGPFQAGVPAVTLDDAAPRAWVRRAVFGPTL